MYPKLLSQIVLAFLIIQLSSGQTVILFTSNTNDTTNYDTTATGYTFDVANGVTATLTGIVSGTGPVNKDGSGTLDFDQTGTFSGILNVRSGTARINAGLDNVGEIRVGYLTGENGNLSILGSSSAVTTAAPIRIGNLGTGSLTIQNGGTLTNSGSTDLFGSMSLGVNASGNGSVSLSGSGSEIDLSGYLNIGEKGQGTLQIQSGATVSAVNASFGAFGSSSDGRGTISGTNSKLEVNGNLAIANEGFGKLTLNSGGKVDTDEARIGASASGIGELYISGSGSEFLSSDFFVVGGSGSGTVTVSNGGTLNTHETLVTTSSGGTGTVALSGSGTVWNNADYLSIGSSGAGSLLIENGAKASARWVDIGTWAGSNGTVTITGAGSLFDVFGGEIYIAWEGTGVLNVQNSGTFRQSNEGAGLDIIMGVNSGSSSGTISIGGNTDSGGPTSPGILDVSGITTGSGTGTVNFNHTASNYHFTRNGSASGSAVQISGTTRVNHKSGTTNLYGTQSFSGNTSISGGILNLMGTMESSPVILSGGVFSPGGNSPTTRNLSSLQWTGGIINFDLGTNSDFLNITGSFTGGGSLDFNFMNEGWMSGQTYDLISFTTTDINIANFGFTNSGAFDGTFAFNGANDTLQFTVTAIPEPQTYAVLLGLLGLIVVGVRRKYAAKSTSQTE